MSKKKQPTATVLTTEQVAQVLQVSPRRVRELIQAGRLPGSRQVRRGRDWLVLPAAIDDYLSWVDGCREKPGAHRPPSTDTMRGRVLLAGITGDGR